ncbi:hypothetical protein HX089_12085 [Myroides odoratimimus]|uniref:hypothetical protein n=1 Tax=Myroides odoratimimus TaxID=76832 RepID=UPI000A53C105|nr:hypothetical protein [Myroides odoratimimus]MDM1517126.1 hypothetical protein [Myroides odoratimimus]MDM1520161.1 hypothetical protein [Myroides odoratimimus]
MYSTNVFIDQIELVNVVITHQIRVQYQHWTKAEEWVTSCDCTPNLCTVPTLEEGTNEDIAL